MLDAHINISFFERVVGKRDSGLGVESRQAEVNQWGLWESETGAFPLGYPADPLEAWHMHLRAELHVKQTAELLISFILYLHTGIVLLSLWFACLWGNLFVRIIFLSMWPSLHYMTLLGCVFFRHFWMFICILVFSFSYARQRGEDKARLIPENL